MPNTDDSRSTKSGKSSTRPTPSTAPTSPETHRAGMDQQPPDNFLDMSSDGGSSTRGSAATSPRGSAASSPARGSAAGSSARGAAFGSPVRGAAVGSPLRGPPIVSPTGSQSFLDTHSTPDAWERRPPPGTSAGSPAPIANPGNPGRAPNQPGAQSGQSAGLGLSNQWSGYSEIHSNLRATSRHPGSPQEPHPRTPSSGVSYASNSGDQLRQRSGNMSPLGLDARNLPGPASSGQPSPAGGRANLGHGERPANFQTFGGAFPTDPSRHNRTESGPSPRTGTEPPPQPKPRAFSDSIKDLHKR